MPYAYPGPRLVVLSSHHRDAEMLVRILRRFGLDIARGSSTRGGAAGLRAVVKKASLGYDVGLTPDGPRGPRRRVAPGILLEARLCGLPIVPVVPAAPAGCARGTALLRARSRRGLFGTGIHPDSARRGDEAEALRRTLEVELDRITDLADAETGVGPEDAREPLEAP
jgi:hypothetical protein